MGLPRAHGTYPGVARPVEHAQEPCLGPFGDDGSAATHFVRRRYGVAAVLVGVSD